VRKVPLAFLVVMLVFVSHTVSATAREWQGAFPPRAVAGYLAVAVPPETPAQWVEMRARIAGIHDRQADLVVSGLVGDSSEALKWAADVTSMPGLPTEEKVFALAVLARHDPGRLREPSVNEKPAQPSPEFCDALRGQVAATPRLLRLAKEPGIIAGLANSLVEFLERGIPPPAPALQAPEGFLMVYGAAFTRQLKQAEIAELQSFLSTARSNGDENTEVLARAALFHQTDELELLSEGLKRSPGVVKGMLAALAELGDVGDATQLLLDTARKWESLPEPEEFAFIHPRVLDALGRHHSAGVTEYLGGLLSRPTEYSTSASLRRIIYVLCSRPRSSNARSSVTQFYRRHARLLVETEVWVNRGWGERPATR
jgi:hypothetical protein